MLDINSRLNEEVAMYTLTVRDSRQKVALRLSLRPLFEFVSSSTKQRISFLLSTTLHGATLHELTSMLT